MKFKEYIDEAGFSKYPKGWYKDSVIKFAETLGKETGLGPKDEGFFDVCVKRMEKHMGEGAKGFCASLKSEAWGSTYWRGKDKTKEDVKKQVKEHPLEKQKKEE